MSPIAGIGMVILIGVVVNNGLYSSKWSTGFDARLTRFDAVVKAGEQRIRPILMTALTTICGLMPMAMGDSAAGGISYGPMGKVVVGGMVMGTFLTLFFIPLMYLILDDMRQRAGMWLRWIAGPRTLEEGAMIFILMKLALADASLLSYEEALRFAAKRNPEILKSSAAIRIAQGGLTQAKAIFDPQFNAEYTRRFSTSQQFFAGFGLFDTESSGNAWNLGLSTYLPSGTSVSLDWQTNQNTTRYVFSDGQVEQEFSPYDTRLSLNIVQPLLEGFSTSYILRNVREPREI